MSLVRVMSFTLIGFEEIWCSHSSRSQQTFNRIKEVFPNALTNDDLIKNIELSLQRYGFGKNSLVATALCCDEVNRTLEKDLGKMYDHHFSMGGLAGFAFGGVTSFGAMAHHIPDGGSCLIVYGPHVGVDADGNVGTVNRRGRHSGGSCCGSAIAASKYVKDVSEGICQQVTAPEDPVDAQQVYVGNMLLPYATRIHKAREPMVELPFALFDAQDALMAQIVAKGCGAVAGEGKIALLGGIQINTPPGMPDYFLPLRFDIMSNKGKCLDKIIEAPSRVSNILFQDIKTIIT